MQRLCQGATLTWHFPPNIKCLGSRHISSNSLTHTGAHPNVERSRRHASANIYTFTIQLVYDLHLILLSTLLSPCSGRVEGILNQSSHLTHLEYGLPTQIILVSLAEKCNIILFVIINSYCYVVNCKPVAASQMQKLSVVWSSRSSSVVLRFLILDMEGGGIGLQKNVLLS